jgi:hypothetical protein
MRRTWVLAVAVIVLTAVSAMGSPVVARVGGPLSDDPSETFDDLIFTGTAVRVVDPRGPFDVMSSSPDLMEWTFVVDDVRKGSAPSRVTVRSERNGASCGTEFRLGIRYRVVAIDRDDGLYTGQGYGTKKIDPLADPPAVEASFSWPPRLDAFGVLVIIELGLLVALIMTTRQRRRSRPRIG